MVSEAAKEYETDYLPELQKRMAAHKEKTEASEQCAETPGENSVSTGDTIASAAPPAVPIPPKT